jgi:hypothetical protein
MRKSRSLLPAVARIAASVTAVVALALLPASAQAAASGLGYGYVVTGSTYQSISADWNVPTPHCTSASTSASIWIGLDGYSSPTVEQTGIDVDCVGGTPQYFGWYELYPAGPVDFSNTVHAGDSMAASVTASGKSQFTLTLEDVTQGWSKVIHQSLAGAALSSAEAIVTDPDSLTCSTVDFTAVTVDGSPLGSENPVKVTGGNPGIIVSPVKGSAFNVSWVTTIQP